MKKITVVSLVFALLFVLCACTPVPAQIVDGTARYTTDTELGTGSKTLIVKVVDNEEKAVTFTIHTDAKTVGEALLENKLIAGEDGDYGLYIKVVNGIRADYDKDGAYWGFFKNGEYMMTGVDTTEFADGDSYELVYTKG